MLEAYSPLSGPAWGGVHEQRTFKIRGKDISLIFWPHCVAIPVAFTGTSVIDYQRVTRGMGIRGTYPIASNNIDHILTYDSLIEHVWEKFWISAYRLNNLHSEIRSGPSRTRQSKQCQLLPTGPGSRCHFCQPRRQTPADFPTCCDPTGRRRVSLAFPAIEGASSIGFAGKCKCKSLSTCCFRRPVRY